MKFKIQNSGFKLFLILTLMFTLVLGLTLSANAAYSVKQTWARISATAGETLTVGDVVSIKDADGYAYKADANNSALRPAVGIVGMAATSGNKAEIVVYGIVTGWSSLSEGLPGYLSETAGAITQTAPTYAQQVAVAVNTTDYMVNFQDNIVKSKKLTIATDDTTLTTADCGQAFGMGTDAKTFTLPSTTAECEITFVNTGAAGNNILNIDPAAADGIYGTVTLAASVVVINGADGEILLNTKATSKRGDSVTLLGDGVDGWYIIGSTGIWAEASP